jgi:hypothetical protein
MNELNCTWPELAQRAKEFHELAPSAKTHDELDQLWKMFGLSYLNADLKDGRIPEDVMAVQAAAVFRIVQREYVHHLIRLDESSYVSLQSSP